MKVFTVCRRDRSSPYKSKGRTAVYARGETKTKFTQQVNTNRTPGFLANTVILWPADCSLPGVIVEKGPFLQLTRKNSSYQSSAVYTLESTFLKESSEVLSIFRCTFISVADLFSSK